jgi:ferrochelatase
MTTGSESADPRYVVLLVAYGSPNALDEVEPYLNDVRGRYTPPDIVAELRQRYAAIGGRSPLLERTESQARALQAALGGIPVYVGMRHWHPYIADVATRIRAEGHRRVVALALAPHFSRMSIGAYQRKIAAASDGLAVTLVTQWFDHPAFLDAVSDRVRAGLARFDSRLPSSSPSSSAVPVVFTAHSLPERILQDGDPYPDQLRASVAGVVQRLGLPRALVAFQSAGRTQEPWLGPDVGEVVRILAAEGARRVLVCPIGFVSDHLEVLYDIDIELQALARSLGVHLERTASLNDHPLLITALADLTRSAAASAGWI